MDNLLPGFEPSEADMIQMALDMPLERKVEKAIKFFQTYCEGAYGAFSGGKDSCVIKELAGEARVNVDWYYNNTTIDSPEIVAFIRKHHADVKWNNPPIGFFNRIVQRGDVPTRLNRWCCAEFKEGGGDDRNKIIGVRIAESPRRAKLWKTVVPNTRTGKLMLAPIVYWTDADVWQYIESRSVPYCDLYDEGFDRLGCVGCPMAGSRGRKEQFKRWPRFEQAWRRAFHKLWNAKSGTLNRMGKPRYFEKFGSADAFFEWWLSGEKHDGDGCVFEEMMEQR